MSVEKATADAAGPDRRWMDRVGGISALVLGIAYLATMALYAPVGAPPLGGEAWLTYATGKTSVWSAIVGLAVLTDLLFVPVAFSLYLVLRGVHRSVMLLATACSHGSAG